MFRIKCPYCKNYDEVQLSLEKEYTGLDVSCSSCNKNYQISCHVTIVEHGDKEELINAIPKELVNAIHAVCFKYTGKTIKQGDAIVVFNDSATENIEGNEIMITLSAKHTLFGNREYRTVKFFVDVNGRVNPRIRSEFEWIEKRHFKGDTLEDKVDNYISELLVNWHII